MNPHAAHRLLHALVDFALRQDLAHCYRSESFEQGWPEHRGLPTGMIWIGRFYSGYQRWHGGWYWETASKRN